MKWKNNIVINNSKIIIQQCTNPHCTTVSSTSDESAEEFVEDRTKTVKKEPMSTKPQTIEPHSIPQSQKANSILNEKKNDATDVYATIDRPGTSRRRLPTRLRSRSESPKNYKVQQNVYRFLRKTNDSSKIINERTSVVREIESKIVPPQESLDVQQTSNGELKNGEENNAAFVDTVTETEKFEVDVENVENDHAMQSFGTRKETKVNGDSNSSHSLRNTPEIEEEDAVAPVETGTKKAYTMTPEKRQLADEKKGGECSVRKNTSERILDKPVPSTSANLPGCGFQPLDNYLVLVDACDSGSDTMLLPVSSAPVNDTAITTKHIPTIPSTNDEKVNRNGKVQEWLDKNSQQTAAKKATKRSLEMIHSTDSDDDETQLLKVLQTKRNNLERINPTRKAKEKKNEADNDSIDSEYSYKGKKIWERMYGPITVEDRKCRKRLQFEQDFCPKRGKVPPQREFSQDLLDALHQDLMYYQSLRIEPHKIIIDLAMLHYFICRPSDIRICGGYEAFKRMLDEKWKVLQGKTFLQLQYRFYNYVRGYIDQFGLPQPILNEFILWQYMKNQK